MDRNSSRYKQALVAERLAATQGLILRDHVLTMRAEGHSWAEIVWDLHDRTRIRLAPRTVMLWHTEWADGQSA